MNQSLAEKSVVSRDQSVARTTLRDYIDVTKPKHQFVLFTTWVSMRLASPEVPLDLLFFTLFGTALAVASSHVFNQVLDRDFDALMSRTKDRPVASGRLSRKSALIYGTILGILSLVVTVLTTNPLTVLLVFLGWFIYVVLYTYWLKRRSPWCTLVGGTSGAMPSMIGWAAVTGSLAPIPVLLFVWMTIWQSPHFFALSLFREQDYRAANFPVVVVRYGKMSTLRRMMWQTPLLLVTSMLLYVFGVGYILFPATVLAAGAIYLYWIAKANIAGEEHAAAWGKRLFHFSYVYLLLTFATAAIDGVVRVI